MARCLGAALLALTLALAGCDGDAGGPAGEYRPPTVSGLFEVKPTWTPTATRPPLPTSPVRPTAPPSGPTPTATPTLANLPAAVVYSDTLAAGWTLAHSWGMSLTVTARAPAHGGAVAIAVTPQKDYGGLFFAVSDAASPGYTRDRYLGLRFWLNPGDQDLGLEQLAVAFTGSNTTSAWVQGDTSAPIDEESFASETRLYWLGFNRPLPANTWTQVSIWLDDLQYEPDYTYITGFYIKNDAGYRHTFYVDDVALIALPGS